MGDRPIGSPLLEEPTAALIFNQPSLVKFGPRLNSGGLLLVNSSTVRVGVERFDLVVYQIPAEEMSRQVGLARAANMVLLGAYSAKSGVVLPGVLEAAIREYFGAEKASGGSKPGCCGSRAGRG